MTRLFVSTKPAYKLQRNGGNQNNRLCVIRDSGKKQYLPWNNSEGNHFGSRKPSEADTSSLDPPQRVKRYPSGYTKGQGFLEGSEAFQEEKRLAFFDEAMLHPNFGGFGRGKMEWYALWVATGRGDATLAADLETAIESLPLLKHPVGAEEEEGEGLSDGVANTRKAEAYVPTRRINTWNPRRHKMGSVSQKYGGGSWLLLRCVMDNEVHKIISEHKMIFGFKAEGFKEVMSSQGYSHVYPLPLTPHFLAKIDEWLEVTEDERSVDDIKRELYGTAEGPTATLNEKIDDDKEHVEYVDTGGRQTVRGKKVKLMEKRYRSDEYSGTYDNPNAWFNPDGSREEEYADKSPGRRGGAGRGRASSSRVEGGGNEWRDSRGRESHGATARRQGGRRGEWDEYAEGNGGQEDTWVGAGAEWDEEPARRQPSRQGSSRDDEWNGHEGRGRGRRDGPARRGRGARSPQRDNWRSSHQGGSSGSGRGAESSPWRGEGGEQWEGGDHGNGWGAVSDGDGWSGWGDDADDRPFSGSQGEKRPAHVKGSEGEAVGQTQELRGADGGDSWNELHWDATTSNAWGDDGRGGGGAEQGGPGQKGGADRAAQGSAEEEASGWLWEGDQESFLGTWAGAVESDRSTAPAEDESSWRRDEAGGAGRGGEAAEAAQDPAEEGFVWQEGGDSKSWASSRNEPNQQL